MEVDVIFYLDKTAMEEFYMLNIYLNLEIIEDNLYKEIDNKNFAGKDSIRNKSHHISNKDCIEAEGKKHSGIRKLRKRIKNVSKKAMIEKKKRLAAQKEEFIKAGDILKKKIDKAIAYRIAG